MNHIAKLCLPGPNRSGAGKSKSLWDYNSFIASGGEISRLVGTGCSMLDKTKKIIPYSIKHPETSIQRQASRDKHPETSIQRQASSICLLLANQWYTVT
jgi:hypothetical protein